METPTIVGAVYASSVVEPLFNQFPPAPKQSDQAEYLAKRGLAQAQGLQIGEPRRLQPGPAQAYVDSETQKVKAQPMSTARIVKVFIADPNENLPLDKRVLYTGPEQLTDLTDQELFFEVPITELLKEHNRVRVAMRDKKAGNTNGEPVMLEPARIRDLKMVVVTVATF